MDEDKGHEQSFKLMEGVGMVGMCLVLPWQGVHAVCTCCPCTEGCMLHIRECGVALRQHHLFHHPLSPCAAFTAKPLEVQPESELGCVQLFDLALVLQVLPAKRRIAQLGR